MDGKCDNILVLEMNVSDKVVDHYFRRSIRGQFEARFMHSADAARIRADDDEHRPRRLLQERKHGLKQEDRTDGVHREGCL